MKLLFDQNVSPRLISLLDDLFPGSNHVFLLQLDTADDAEIRAYAAANDFVIVTKDADYSELHSLFGAPPKVIWIRQGNCATGTIERILRNHFDNICRLRDDIESGILAIY